MCVYITAECVNIDDFWDFHGLMMNLSDNEEIVMFLAATEVPRRLQKQYILSYIFIFWFINKTLYK